MREDQTESPHAGCAIVAEVRLFGCGFAPVGWEVCDGREIPITGRGPLFSLIGWRFGGDGWTTFALPDLRSELEPGLVPAVAARGVAAATEVAHA